MIPKIMPGCFIELPLNRGLNAGEFFLYYIFNTPVESCDYILYQLGHDWKYRFKPHHLAFTQHRIIHLCTNLKKTGHLLIMKYRIHHIGTDARMPERFTDHRGKFTFPILPRPYDHTRIFGEFIPEFGKFFFRNFKVPARRYYNAVGEIIIH